MWQHFEMPHLYNAIVYRYTINRRVYFCVHAEKWLFSFDIFKLLFKTVGGLRSWILCIIILPSFRQTGCQVSVSRHENMPLNWPHWIFSSFSKETLKNECCKHEKYPGRWIFWNKKIKVWKDKSMVNVFVIDFSPTISSVINTLYLWK